MMIGERSPRVGMVGELNGILAGMRADGTVAAIMDRYR